MHQRIGLQSVWHMSLISCQVWWVFGLHQSVVASFSTAEWNKPLKQKRVSTFHKKKALACAPNTDKPNDNKQHTRLSHHWQSWASIWRWTLSVVHSTAPFTCHSITAELLAGARALSLADRHHFDLNLSDLLDKSTQYKRNWLLNVIAARQRFERQQATFEGIQTLSIANSKLIKWMTTGRAS